MCHVLLAMPILGLVAFWLWPASVALPVYLIVVAVSGLLYYFVLQAMRRPVETGAERIRNETGVVVAARAGKLQVRIGSELWQAVGAESGLRRGDRVQVVGLDGLTLRVRRLQEARR